MTTIADVPIRSNSFVEPATHGLSRRHFGAMALAAGASTPQANAITSVKPKLIEADGRGSPATCPDRSQDAVSETTVFPSFSGACATAAARGLSVSSLDRASNFIMRPSHRLR